MLSLTLLLLGVFSTSLVVSDSLATIEKKDDLTNQHVDSIRDLGDGEHILVRSRRSANPDVCKYKKGM